MKSTSILLLLGALGLTATAAAFWGQTGAHEDRALTKYYASGKLQMRVEVDESGRKNGRSERWYANGTPQEDGQLVNGVMQGEWAFWNADGSLDEKRSGTYADGERVSR